MRGERPAMWRGDETFPRRAPAEEGQGTGMLGLPHDLMPFLSTRDSKCPCSVATRGRRTDDRWGMPAGSPRSHCLSAPGVRLASLALLILFPDPQGLRQPRLHPPPCPPLLFRNKTPGLESMVGSHSNGPFSCFHSNQHPDHLVASQLTAVSE